MYAHKVLLSHALESYVQRGLLSERPTVLCVVVMHMGQNGILSQRAHMTADVDVGGPPLSPPAKYT